MSPADHGFPEAPPWSGVTGRNPLCEPDSFGPALILVEGLSCKQETGTEPMLTKFPRTSQAEHSDPAKVGRSDVALAGFPDFRYIDGVSLIDGSGSCHVSRGSAGQPERGKGFPGSIPRFSDAARSPVPADFPHHDRRRLRGRPDRLYEVVERSPGRRAVAGALPGRAAATRFADARHAWPGPGERVAVTRADRPAGSRRPASRAEPRRDGPDCAPDRDTIRGVGATRPAPRRQPGPSPRPSRRSPAKLPSPTIRPHQRPCSTPRSSASRP